MIYGYSECKLTIGGVEIRSAKMTFHETNPPPKRAYAMRASYSVTFKISTQDAASLIAFCNHARRPWLIRRHLWARATAQKRVARLS